MPFPARLHLTPTADRDEVRRAAEDYAFFLREAGHIEGHVLLDEPDRLVLVAQVRFRHALDRSAEDFRAARERARLTQRVAGKVEWAMDPPDDAPRHPEVPDDLLLFTAATEDGAARVITSTKDRVVVPLYALQLPERVLYDLAVWAGTYQAHDKVWLASGSLERAAYRELAEVDSPLNREGRRLARAIEEATGRRTWSFLLRDHGFVRKESELVCPACGGPWFHPDRPDDFRSLGSYSFVCEPCRLVSTHGMSHDGSRWARIGARLPRARRP